MVYINDMLVKSQSSHNHIADLQEAFNILCQYKMKLNLVKCMFGVTSSKFFKFMVSSQGIEANPEKFEWSKK